MTDETIEKLRAELEKAKEQLRMPHPVGEVSFTLGALQDENDRLREALEKEVVLVVMQFDGVYSNPNSLYGPFDSEDAAEQFYKSKGFDNVEWGGYSSQIFYLKDPEEALK